MSVTATPCAPKPCFSSSIQVKPNKKYGLKDDDESNILKAYNSYKINVPSMRRQSSPFKHGSRKSLSISQSLVQKPTNIDKKCMVIESFKGWSESAPIENCIPCLFLRNQSHCKTSDKIMIYFHGNAEDLGRTLLFLKMMQAQMK